MDTIFIGTMGSLIAGMATFLGGLPILFIKKLSLKTQDILLGFSAGIMLSASFFSLIAPSLEVGKITFDELAVLITSIGILSGAIVLRFFDKVLPHEHFIKGKEGIDFLQVKRMWLFIIAITLHNFPEGLAVGVGFGGDDFGDGLSLAIGIGLQNMPEGLIIAIAMVSLNYSKKLTLLIVLFSGLVEPIGGFIGSVLSTFSQSILSFGLAFAGGAMLYVISHEIIPETHQRDSAIYATYGLLFGFIVMMNLDFLL